MSRDSNEQGHVSQRYQHETLPIPYATPTPSTPIPSSSRLYREAWQNPLTDTAPFYCSFPYFTVPTALSSIAAFTIPSPYYKYPHANVNVQPTKAVLCAWAPPAIPAPTSIYDDDTIFVNVKNDISARSPANSAFPSYGVGRNEYADERGNSDVDNVKRKRAPQVINESVSSSTETASRNASLSQSSLTPSTSSSFLTSLDPGSSSSTPPTFTSTSTGSTSLTTITFPSTSLAPGSTTTPANGVTSSSSITTPMLTTGTTTTTGSSSTSSSTTTMPFSITPILRSLPTTFRTSSFTTSISDLPTSLTTPPSASVPSVSLTTSGLVTITNITSFTSSSSTFTSLFNTTFTSSSVPDPTSSNVSSSLTQSSTFTSPPSMVISSSITSRVLSTSTTTNVYTSMLSDGRTTVVTTVIQTGVLSTNTSLSGNRFSRNTGGVIAVAVCATAGVIISVFAMFFLCKRYRDRQERQHRRRSRRPGLRLPAVPVSGPGTGNSGGSGRDSRANILGTGGEWSRSRSIEGGDVAPSDDGEGEEDVWRSPLVGEDDEDVMGVGGVGMTTPPESGEGKPASGRKSSIGHQSGHSHSLGHSQSSSAQHVQGVPPSMTEFGMGPVSYAAYAYPPGLVGYPAYHPGAVPGSSGEGSGVPGGVEEQCHGLDSHGSHGSRASFGAFVPSNGPLVPYPFPAVVSGVGPSCYVPPPTNAEVTEDKPGQRPTSSRRESEEASSAAGGSTTVISASAATTAGASGLVSTPAAGTFGSRGTSGSKGSLRSIGSKNLRGFMDRIRTSVPNIQTGDILPTRRSSKDMASPTPASDGRPGYDYGAVGRSRHVSGEVPAPPPVAFVYPGFHAAPPGVPSNLPSNPQVHIPSHYHEPIPYGYLASPVRREGEGGVDGDEDDSLRITGGVVTDGLLDPNLSRSANGGVDDSSFGGRSSPNVEEGSLRDYVDYSRRIGGMVKNHITRSTTTFDTVEQDGSIHLFTSGMSTPG